MSARRLATFLILAALANAEGPECQTPLGVPCYTIRSTSTQWSAFDGGSLSVSGSKSTTVQALRKDGSRAILNEATYYNSPANFTGQKYVSALLYLTPTNEVVTLRHTERRISRRESQSWQDRPYRRSREGDGTCATGILHFGTDFTITGVTTVAGTPVVKWSRSIGNGSEDQYLAPSLDCISLKYDLVRRNVLYVPTVINSSQADSVELGEPDESHFTIPDGYRDVEDRIRPTSLP